MLLGDVIGVTNEGGNFPSISESFPIATSTSRIVFPSSSKKHSRCHNLETVHIKSVSKLLGTNSHRLKLVHVQSTAKLLCPVARKEAKLFKKKKRFLRRETTLPHMNQFQDERTPVADLIFKILEPHCYCGCGNEHLKLIQDQYSLHFPVNVT